MFRRVLPRLSLPNVFGTSTPAVPAPAAIDSVNCLAKKLLRCSSQGGMPPSKNEFVSGFSVASSISISALGARGDTARELLHNALSCSSSTPQETALAQLSDVHKAVQGRPEDQVSVPYRGKLPQQVRIANTLYVNTRTATTAPSSASPLSPHFSSAAENMFNATVDAMDFAQDAEKARASINDHVAAATNDCITDLLPGGSIQADTPLVIVNALHFKGYWVHPFQKRKTREEPFYLHKPQQEEESPSPAPRSMMHVEAKLRYAAPTPISSLHHVDEECVHLDVEYVSLPYVHGKFAMEIIVPPLDVVPSHDAAQQRLDGDDSEYPTTNLERLAHIFYNQPGSQVLGKLRAAAQNTLVDLALPKFSCENGGSIRPHLQKHPLSLKNCFSEADADFSGLFSEQYQQQLAAAGKKVFIQDVVHRTVLKVNEEGSEAAAATAVVFATESSIRMAQEPERPVVLRVDRPSMVFLTHVETGVQIMSGFLMDPA